MMPSFEWLKTNDWTSSPRKPARYNPPDTTSSMVAVPEIPESADEIVESAEVPIGPGIRVSRSPFESLNGWYEQRECNEGPPDLLKPSLERRWRLMCQLPNNTPCPDCTIHLKYVSRVQNKV